MPKTDEARGLGDRVFTVPNALSFLRLFMVPVVVALLLAGSDGIAAALFVLAAATAVLMGAVALVVIRLGVVGEVIFYAGLGLPIVAGLMYLRSLRRIL